MRGMKQQVDSESMSEANNDINSTIEVKRASSEQQYKRTGKEREHCDRDSNKERSNSRLSEVREQVERAASRRSRDSSISKVRESS